MLKRAHPPFTPEPATAAHSLANKKNREYQSPSVNKTPLRNVIRENEAMSSSGLASRSSAGLGGSPLINNDDVAEKRQHRVALVTQRRHMKKAIMSPATITPKANPPGGLTPRRNTTPSLGAGHAGTPSAINPKLATAAADGAAQQKLTTEQRNKMFEEWMKIAADNVLPILPPSPLKPIELTFLRDGDSINFQKASCTLDGCVKIYSTRVDAVADETGKLLNGLIDGKNLNAESDVLTVIDSEERTTAASKFITKKRPHKSVDTLAPNFEQLTLKNFDMEFSMDPLFKKMCAEFDDSSAKGFLTSRLGMNSEGKLVFDSLDEGKITENEEISNAEVEIVGLLESFGRDLMALEAKTISPSLADYSFKVGMPVDGILSKVDKRLAEVLSKLATASISVTGATNVTDRMDMVDSDEDLDFNQESHQGDSGIFEGDPLSAAVAILQDEVVPLNDDYCYDGGDAMETEGMPSQQAMRGPPSLPIAAEETTFAPMDPREASFLAYFDNRLQKNWAGPEHWKIQRPHLRRPLAGASEAGSMRPSRGVKKDFSLDFYAGGALLLDHQTLFQRANPATITLSKSSLDERNERDTLLPEDLHFSSSSLLQLFLKPAWRIARHTTVVRKSPDFTATATDEDRPDLSPNEVTPAYWAGVSQGASGTTAADEIVPPNDNDEYGDDYFEYGSGEVVENTDSAVPPETDAAIGDNLVPVTRPALFSAITYARRAKKIDVQELKRVLWNEIADTTSNRSKSVNPSNSSTSSTRFTQLLVELPSTSFPKDMLKEVSVPYCFICLLHLANEHDLELSADIQSGDLTVNVPRQCL